MQFGRLHTQTGHTIFRTVDIEQNVPGTYAILHGGYALSTSVTPTAVPEPASLLFVGTGLVGLALRRRSSKGH